MRKNVLLIALALACANSAQATTVPYEVAVDQQIANRIDVYNPFSGSGLNTPVETIDVVFRSSSPSPAHLVVDSPNGSTPGASVFIDAYFDGSQIQGNEIAFNSRMFFATPTDASGNQISVGVASSSGGGPTFDAQIDAAFPTVFSPPISYDFFGTAGAGWPNGQFLGINAGAGQGLLATGVDYGGGTLVDPTQPISRDLKKKTRPRSSALRLVTANQPACDLPERKR